MRIPLHNLFKRYSQRAGLPPGTLVYVGEERTERVQVSFIDYNESYLHEREVKTIEECLPFIPAETVTWVRIEGIHVAGFISEIGELYCHRKLGPLSKPRLWYNYNLIIRSIRWRNENEEASPPSLKRRLFLRPSAVKVPKRKCAGGEPNLSEDQLSKWKQQLVENAETSLFASTDKQSSEAAERIAHFEQLVGRLTVALDIQKKPRLG